GWVIYNTLCRVFVDANQTTLMVALFGVLVVMSYFYTSVFSGRAAMLHLGAFTATIMSANVFMIIIPNQKIVVDDLIAGRTPDAKYGKIAKQRSTHNNYLTLPVIFLMLSNHYPLAFATQYTWLIASLVFLMGVTIRHYFNSIHARKGDPHWTWAVTTLIFILIMWLSTAPMFRAGEPETAEGRALRFAQAEGFDAVQDIVLGRCSMCHAAEPVWKGLHWAPKGVRFETEYQIARQAREIYLHSGISHAMPPANLSYMEEAERAQIVAWYLAATNS
ncbi:MAG: urate hydroxylase PuuD, partial [Pseudomonadota bacterium]